MDFFEHALRTMAAIVWGPQTVILLLGVGFFLTIRLRFVQLRRLGLSFRFGLGQKDFGETAKEREGDITPVQA